MARPKLVRHDDIQDIVCSEEWQHLASDMRLVLNIRQRNEDRFGADRADALRAILFAFSVSSIASECDDCGCLVLPHRIDEDASTAIYYCEEDNLAWIETVEPWHINEPRIYEQPF